MKSVKLFDGLGVVVSSVSLGVLSPGIKALGTFYAKNDGDVVTVEGRVAAVTKKGHWRSTTNAEGYEIMTRKMVEARIEGGSWVPIGGSPKTPGNYATFAGLTVGNQVQIELRINVPSDAQTAGEAEIGLRLFFR